MPDEQWAPAARASAARTVPGYTDLVEVARGGDSIVYRARQESLERDVAIKVVELDDPAAVARFQRELEITVRLGRAHPHIVTVLDTTRTTAGEPCLVMDFHDLGSVHDRLVEVGPLPATDVVEAGTAVADALAFAHAADVLHRDVKPQNILVLPTSYVLSDFGIARRADAGRTASLERFSYRHAAPQVLDGLTPTVADDVWSLGSTLFTLLEGRAPFAADDPDDDTALAYLRRVRMDQRRPMRRDDLPAGLREVVEGCLVPDRESRIGTAAQVLAMLRGIRTEGRSWAPGAAVTTGVDAAGSGSGPAAVAVPSDPPRGESADDESVAAPPRADPTPDASVSPAGSSAAPVARSALADLEDGPSHTRAGAGHDDDATGTLADAAPPAPEPAPRRHPWRKAAAFVGGMLLAGAAIGIVTALLSGHDTDPAPATAPDTSVPTTVALPPDDTVAQATVSDPALAPRDLVVTDRGTSALLTWAKPQRDVDFLVVVRLPADGDPVALAHLSASAEEYTVEGLDPDASACFAIVGYGRSDGSMDAGASTKACTAEHSD